jgi:hypothetical protein
MYIAVGSEDGYIDVWEACTGFMVGRKEPKKRHTASVSLFSTFMHIISCQGYLYFLRTALTIFWNLIGINPPAACVRSTA